MEPVLAALVALQALDSAAAAARRRLAELPAAEQALAARAAEVTAAVEAAKAHVQQNQLVRRQLERDVAAVDVRLGRFKLTWSVRADRRRRYAALERAFFASLRCE